MSVSIDQLYGLLQSVSALLTDTAADRREQANMFYSLLEKQAVAIADSEQRIGQVNTMVSNLISFCNSMQEERVSLSRSLDKSMGNYEGMVAQLRKLTALYEAQQIELERIRAENRALLDRLVEVAKGGGHSENKIEIKK